MSSSVQRLKRSLYSIIYLYKLSTPHSSRTTAKVALKLMSFTMIEKQFVLITLIIQCVGEVRYGHISVSLGLK